MADHENATSFPLGFDRKLKYAVLATLIGHIGIGFAFFSALRDSGSSLGLNGLVLFPFLLIKVWIPSFIFGFGLPDLARILRKIAGRTVFPWTFSAVASLVMAVWIVRLMVYGMSLSFAVDHARYASAEKLESLIVTSAFKDNILVRGAIALNANTTAKILDWVAQRPDPEPPEPILIVWPITGTEMHGTTDKRLVAQHANVSAETLEFLAKSPNSYVRSSVAQNEKTPVSVLRQLASTDDFTVLMSLSYNSQTPPDILEKLSGSESEYTRAGVARNSSADPDVLSKLARDTEWVVRRDAAMNPRLSITDLSTLADDPDESVRDAAQSAIQERQGQ